MNYGTDYSLSDIAAVTNGNNGNDGFGGNNSWWIVLFLVVLFGGWGRGFGGGYGGGYGSEGGSRTSVYEGYVLNNDFSQLSKQISDAYSMTERKLDGINNGLCSLGYQELQNINGVNTNIFNATSGIQNTLTQGFAGLNTGMVQQGYETRIGINGIGSQLANCCCDLKAQLADNKYEMAKGFCATNNTITLSTRDIVDNMNANYRALHDEIVANRIEDKNAQIASLQAQLNNAELRASQEAQSAYLLNELKVCPKPAYLTCNPNAPLNYSIQYGNNCGCGCGC